MFDYFTYFIYIGLLVTLVFLTSVKQKFTTAKLDFGVLPKLRLQHFVALLILSFVVGFRYQVGNDWEGHPTWIEYEKEFNQIGVDVIYLAHTDHTSSTDAKP